MRETKSSNGPDRKLMIAKTNGAVEIRSIPLPSYQWRLQATTNLSTSPVNWISLLTNNFTTNASTSNNIVRFLDTNGPSNSRRFYRLINP